MKKSLIIIFLIFTLLFVSSCGKYEDYEEKKKVADSCVNDIRTGDFAVNTVKYAEKFGYKEDYRALQRFHEYIKDCFAYNGLTYEIGIPEGTQDDKYIMEEILDGKWESDYKYDYLFQLDFAKGVEGNSL